jgi:hypothetical protein
MISHVQLAGRNSRTFKSATGSQIGQWRIEELRKYYREFEAMRAEVKNHFGQRTLIQKSEKAIRRIGTGIKPCGL